MCAFIEILRERMVVLGGCHPPLVDLILFHPADSLFAGADGCFMFAPRLACYTPPALLLTA